MQEQWTPVAGYAGSYSVSTTGRVRSEDRFVAVGGGGMRRVASRILKAITNKRTGDVTVSLWSDNVGESLKVSRLVAAAYLSDWDPALEVWHIDGDPGNNGVANLRMDARCVARTRRGRFSRIDHDCNSDEEFRRVPGLQYMEASNLGRIRRVAMTRIVPGYERTFLGKLIRQSGSDVSEPAVILRPSAIGIVNGRANDGTRKAMMVHRLVAAAWIAPLSDGDVVRFRNDDIRDFRAENLKIGRRSSQTKRKSISATGN